MPPANHFCPPQAARAAAACDPHCARPSATEPSYLPTTAPPRVRAHAPPTLPAGRLDHYFTLYFGQYNQPRMATTAYYVGDEFHRG